jgi:hypothetical protein
MGMTAVIPCACCLWSFLLFLIILVVEPLDPALDAAKMEGLATLVAAPKGAPLENAVVTDDTLLGAFRESLNKIGALFCQIAKLPEEIMVIVLYSRSLLIFFIGGIIISV